MSQWVLPPMSQALCAALRVCQLPVCRLPIRQNTWQPWGSIWLRHRCVLPPLQAPNSLPPLQATKFEAEAGAGSQVQHLFNIMSTLLEARMLALKQKCAPAALAVSSGDGSDVEALLDKVSNAIKVICPDIIALLVQGRLCLLAGGGRVPFACRTCRMSFAALLCKTRIANAIKVVHTL